MNSFASRFKAGSDIAKDLLNTYETARRKKEMGDIATQQETTAYTADQGTDLEALANAKDPEGKPYYSLGNDPTGKYTVTPNFKDETGASPAEYAPSTIAAKGVSFLGKNYDAPLTDTQATSARQQAMAGVMEKYGDAEGAMRYRQQAKQGELADMQLTQAKRTGAREDKADAVTATLEGVDKEAGEWMKSRLKNPDGTERVATVDDHLATTQFRANKLMEAGRASEAGALMKDFNAQALVKIQLETAQRTDALKKTSAALAAGDLNAVKDFYNKFTPDGAQVVSVTRDEKGQILIERTTDDGRPMPPHTLKDAGELSAALNSFSDPMALYNWSQNEFKNSLSLKADGRAEKSLGIQQAQLGLSQSSHAAAAGDRSNAKADALAKAAAGLALYKQQNPNASAAELEAVKRGVLSAVPKEGNYKIQFGDVSQAFGTPAVDSEGKPVADLMTGRQVVNRNPAEETKFLQWMKANNITDTNKGLLMYKGAPDGAGNAASGPAKGTEKVISTGSNKGKTAVFDGKGWVLKP